MTLFDVVMCPDGHYQWVVYVLGPYIADYPEQVLLAGVVNGWCVWCVLWSLVNILVSFMVPQLHLSSK